jgi:uncharacterized membrane protein YidH (DUF202 family)
MGFGFVVARFGLFLQQLRLIDHVLSPQSYGVSQWFGTSLIVVGVAVNLSPLGAMFDWFANWTGEKPELLAL